MWILDELRYLHELLVRNIHRLLHLLSTSARKVCSDIYNLLQKLYQSLFMDTPVRVHQRMIDFNRWIAEVLADTRSKGIELGPSYGENPWMAQEVQPPQTQPVVEEFNVDTIQLLKVACEHYMHRSDSLLQTNASLVVQIEELKTQLTEALARAFESEQALQREKEHSLLQVRRVDESVDGGGPELTSTVPREVGEEVTVGNLALTNGSEGDIIHVGGDKTSAVDRIDSDAVEEVESEVATAFYREQAPPTSCSEEAKVQANEPETSQFSKVQSTEASRVEMAMLSSDSDDSDYQKLSQVSVREESSNTWYRHALRSLKIKREQRRLLRKAAKDPNVPVIKKVFVLDDYNPMEYDELVATRDLSGGDEDLTWYRRALHHLKQERKHRCSRAESFSSTISIVD